MLLWSICQSHAPSSLTHEQNPKILDLLHLRQNFTPNQEIAIHPCLTEDHGLKFEGADSHPSHFTFSCELLQGKLKNTTLWHQQNIIICKQGIWNPETNELCSLHPLAAPRNSVHERYEFAVKLPRIKNYKMQAKISKKLDISLC